MNDFRLAKDLRPTHYTLEFDLDLERWTFSATGTIGLTLARPTRDTLHCVDLDIKAAGEVAGATCDEESQTAILKLPKKLPAGSHEPKLTWSGAIAEKVRGPVWLPKGTADQAIFARAR